MSASQVFVETVFKVYKAGADAMIKTSVPVSERLRKLQIDSKRKKVLSEKKTTTVMPWPFATTVTGCSPASV